MSALWSSWGSDPFTEQVEKATSELLPAGQEDIALNLEICDQVRAKAVPAKQAMQVIKRRISHKNPNVVLLALGLTDICIKNGGDHFLAEVASREFMDNLVSVLKAPSGVNHDVKAKALGLIQNWAQISEIKPSQMGYILETYRTLKSEKFDFPPRDPNVVASAALVETMTAPEWTDGEVCMRCRTPFTTFTRKHHCRNCGNVFCHACSSHTMSLPWFGVGQDVRVCDGCYARKAPPKGATAASKLSRSKSSSSAATVTPSGRGGVSSHHRSATLGGKPKRNTKEDDDLALAIKLSLESAAQASGSRSDLYQAPSEPPAGRATRQPDGRMLEGTDAEDDPDLAAAIAASLREYAAPQPSAPDGLTDRATTSLPNVEDNRHGIPKENLNLPPSLDLPPSDVDAILTFAQTVRAQEEYQRRHGIVGAAPHQQAQALYEKASSARPKMARSLEEGARRHGVLVSMHDKLTEAVRLYDRLLDAQMSRPPAQQYPANTAYGPSTNFSYDPRQHQVRQMAAGGPYPHMTSPQPHMPYSAQPAPAPYHPVTNGSYSPAPIVASPVHSPYRDTVYNQGQSQAVPGLSPVAQHPTQSSGLYPTLQQQSRPEVYHRQQYAPSQTVPQTPAEASQVSQPYTYGQHHPSQQSQAPDPGYIQQGVAAPNGYFVGAPPVPAPHGDLQASNTEHYHQQHQQQSGAAQPDYATSVYHQHAIHQEHAHPQGQESQAPSAAMDQQQGPVGHAYIQQTYPEQQLSQEQSFSPQNQHSSDVASLPQLDKLTISGPVGTNADPYQQHQLSQPISGDQSAHSSANGQGYGVSGATDSLPSQPVRYDGMSGSQLGGWNRVAIQSTQPRQAASVNGSENSKVQAPASNNPAPPVPIAGSVAEQKISLPIFPSAPHPDNGFGPKASYDHEPLSTKSPVSSGMWQKEAEAPLIEF
ncbi:hypothetical protein IE53DRAFT_379792 [Violaceomyces palustris]|uniref:Uncharacterized protein n=1 Tax=Violaceomyces palustris TaxID=1673888 RepID=A0ACD0NX40_9BASI|nr:hypothetical protein IE53DRAFT_379792 [Violaceomyces palustris]